jgi:hypothetical protein
MQIISFEMPLSGIIIKTANKYIQVVRGLRGEINFTDMTCLHRGGPLTHGVEENEFIICPWHSQKTKKCSIKYLDVPYVINGETLFVSLPGIERLIKHA